jgi:hypothetical protein
MAAALVGMVGQWENLTMPAPSATGQVPVSPTAVDLRAKNQLTLPREFGDILQVTPGDRIEFAVNAAGDVVVRGLKTIPADQAWFWSPQWQAGEQRASADIAAGRLVTFHSIEEMDAWLDSRVTDD